MGEFHSVSSHPLLLLLLHRAPLPPSLNSEFRKAPLQNKLSDSFSLLPLLKKNPHRLSDRFSANVFLLPPFLHTSGHPSILATTILSRDRAARLSLPRSFSTLSSAFSAWWVDELEEEEDRTERDRRKEDSRSEVTVWDKKEMAAAHVRIDNSLSLFTMLSPGCAWVITLLSAKEQEARSSAQVSEKSTDTPSYVRVQ